MRFIVSYLTMMILSLVVAASLTEGRFGSYSQEAIKDWVEDQLSLWPRSQSYLFHSANGPVRERPTRSDLLGPNQTFTTPTCSRLKIAVERSGETYAGHMMRERMRYRSCRIVAEKGVKKTWDWPWRNGAPRSDLPPHQIGVYGAWTIRCADGIEKNRCVLAQKMQPDERDGAEITTHIAMANIRGKRIPVWRIWIPRHEKSWFRGMSAESVRKWEEMLSSCLHAHGKFKKCLDQARMRFTDRRTNEVWISLNKERRNFNFTKCIEEGCMFESPISISTKAYTEFVRGKDVILKLHPLGNMPLRFEVRADGFHKAIDALSKFDHGNGTLQAGVKGKVL